MTLEISRGFGPSDRATVAALYWEAFGHKLGRVLGPTPDAVSFLDAVLDPQYAAVARDAAGDVVGVVGFKTDQGALVGGGLSDLRKIYGLWGSLWRGAVLSVVERPIAPDLLLMDGICVSAGARGQGLDTRLLDAIKAHAVALGKTGVRLDVIDTNSRAQALYEREGFVTAGRENTGLFKYIFRFSSATQMVWRTSAA